MHNRKRKRGFAILAAIAATASLAFVGAPVASADSTATPAPTHSVTAPAGVSPHQVPPPDGGNPPPVDDGAGEFPSIKYGDNAPGYSYSVSSNDNFAINAWDGLYQEFTRFKFVPSCNILLYFTNASSVTTQVWRTHITGHSNCSLNWQANGNVTIYDNGTKLWQTATAESAPVWKQFIVLDGPSMFGVKRGASQQAPVIYTCPYSTFYQPANYC